MKAFIISLLLLCLRMGDPSPSNRWSCTKKVLTGMDCHGWTAGPQRMRPIDSLQDHYWEGNECAVVCYCNFSELLCCPRDVFFGSIISNVIPCKTSEPGL